MNFEKNIISLYGQQGQEWLKNLSNFTNQIATKWNLTNLQVLQNLSYNYVLSCYQNQNPVILKISFNKNDLQTEALTLKSFSGHGCVKLLEQDIELGALLIQKINPGTSLKSLFPEQDEQAVKIISDVIKKLQTTTIPKDSSFCNISDWLAILDENWKIPKKHLLHARNLKKQLLETTSKQVLLHGDLHHENILLEQQNSWIAIDPKGIIGDPVFEVGSAILNPTPELLQNNNIKNIIQNRIVLFSQHLGFDQKRIFDWTYVQAVMRACWAIQDNTDTEYIDMLLNF